jgi:hypothetical protein
LSNQYKNRVDDLCTDFQALLKEIDQLGGVCTSSRRYLITALLLGPNEKFNNYIDQINDNIETKSGPHKDITVEEIIVVATTKYSTMDCMGDWTRVDPCYAKLLTLTTKVDKLETKNNQLKALGTASQPPPKGGPRHGVDMKGGVDTWRTVKQNQTLMKDGKTWYWCPHHKHPRGEFDGLYCLHKPEDHNEWKAKYRKGKPSTPGSINTGLVTKLLRSLASINVSRRSFAPNSCSLTKMQTTFAKKSTRKTRTPKAWFLA